MSLKLIAFNTVHHTFVVTDSPYLRDFSLQHEKFFSGLSNNSNHLTVLNLSQMT